MHLRNAFAFPRKYFRHMAILSTAHAKCCENGTNHQERPTTLQVTSTVLLGWIRDHSGEDFTPSMLVIANDWTTRIVWAQLDTLSRLGYIAFFPVPNPFVMRHYSLTAHGMYYLEALEHP